MATGVVRKMHRGMVNTPNEGTLMDFSTGREYTFRRPDATLGTVPKAWDVKPRDIVTFTINGNVATGVALYRKSKDGYIYGSFPTFGPSTYIEGVTTGRTFIVAEIGGKLRLVGSTSGIGTPSI